MRVGWILLTVCLLAVFCLPADTPEVPIHAGPVYTRGYEAGSYPQYPDVQIEVDVPPTASVDSKKAEAFHLKVDDRSPIAATREVDFASTGYGMAVSVSLDVSGSMSGGPINAVRSGLLKFVDEAGPQDKVAIQTIADEGRWDSDWGAPHDQVKTTIAGLKVRGNSTRLWDSLLEAIQRYPATPISRRLIVISDGHDEGSTHSEEEVIKMASDHGVIADAIGITREHHEHTETLDRLASTTGGVFRKANSDQELEQLVAGGIQRLKTTPVLSFRIDDVRGDGKSHKLEITWKHDGGESKTVTSAVFPTVGLWRWYWIIGGAAALLLLILVFAIVRSRRPVPAPAPVQPEQEPPAAAPGPVAGAPKSGPGPPKAFMGSAPGAGAKPLPPRKAFPAPDESPGEHISGPSISGPMPSPGGPVKSRSVTKMIARFSAPSADHPAAWLVGTEGPLAGERVAVDRDEFWIGSLDNNHLHIANDPTVSGNHACLVFDHDVLGIYDHHSTNGTYVNGEGIGDKRCLLRPGDRIKIGRTIFSVETGAPGAGV